MKRTFLLVATLTGAFLATHSAGEDNPQDPKRPGLIRRGRTVLFTDNDKSDLGQGIHLGPFAPRITTLSSGSGPGAALHFWLPDIGGTPVSIHASAAYSIYKYRYYDTQIGLVPHLGEHLPRVETSTNALFPLFELEKTSAVPGFNLYASARYRDYTREDFYGLGPNSTEANHAGYRHQDASYEGVVRFRISRLAVMGRAGLMNTSLRPGLDSAWPNLELSQTETTAPGLVTQPDFVHGSAAAWLELRDEPGNAHRGFAGGVAYARFDDRGGRAFQFGRFTADVREYFRLGSDRNVVAFRQTVSLDQVDAGTRVPFYMRSTLGGSGLLRGYGSFRFRDDRFLVFAGEYRFEARPEVELALIYEAGKVSPSTSPLNVRDLRHSYGLGIRLKSPRKVRVRADFVRSVEGMRLDLKLGNSF